MSYQPFIPEVRMTNGGESPLATTIALPWVYFNPENQEFNCRDHQIQQGIKTCTYSDKILSNYDFVLKQLTHPYA